MGFGSEKKASGFGRGSASFRSPQGAGTFLPSAQLRGGALLVLRPHPIAGSMDEGHTRPFELCVFGPFGLAFVKAGTSSSPPLRCRGGPTTFSLLGSGRSFRVAGDRFGVSRPLPSLGEVFAERRRVCAGAPVGRDGPHFGGLLLVLRGRLEGGGVWASFLAVAADTCVLRLGAFGEGDSAGGLSSLPAGKVPSSLLRSWGGGCRRCPSPLEASPARGRTGEGPWCRNSGACRAFNRLCHGAEGFSMGLGAVAFRACWELCGRGGGVKTLGERALGENFGLHRAFFGANLRPCRGREGAGATAEVSSAASFSFCHLLRGWA